MIGGIGARLRLGFGALLFVLAIVLTAPLVALGWTQLARNVMARTMSSGLWLLRMHVTITGTNHLLAARPCVAIGNQQSLLCYAVYAKLYRYIPDSAIVARLDGHWDLPLLTWYFSATDNFRVEPGNRAVTRAGMVSARKALIEDGRRVLIGPEGTRWKVPGELGPFKPGAFRLAIEAGVPIVPMVISPLLPRTSMSEWRFEHNDIELRVLEPVQTAGLTRENEADLIQECRARMQAALSEMAEQRGIRAIATTPIRRTA